MQKILLILFFFSSCAGYRLETAKNPFQQYGVKSISIPSFLNRTSLPNVSSHFTREIILTLSQYPDLKVIAGESVRADAILVGILNSDNKQRNVVRNSGRIYTDTAVSSSIGSRSNFYVPSSSSVRLRMQIVLIKNPTTSQMKIIHSDLLSKAARGPKILINAEIPVNGSFARSVKGGSGPDGGSVVNFTSNQALMNRTIKEMAISAATNFKETIANAF